MTFFEQQKIKIEENIIHNPLFILDEDLELLNGSIQVFS